MSEIIDNSFYIISEYFPFSSQQLDEIDELGSLEQDMGPRNIPNIISSEVYSDININPNKDQNQISTTKINTFLNNKTRSEEFNYEGKRMNNKISNRIEIEITNKTKKKGRKKKSEKNHANLTLDKNIHTKIDDDNIIIKIKTFFLNNFHKYINGLIKESNMKLKKLDRIIKTNIKKDYNIKLWKTTFKTIQKTTFKTIYSEEKICKKYTLFSDKNKKIINAIYNSNDELKKILDLTFGEVFEIFIKDLKIIDSKLLTKVENYEIYKNVEFSNLDNFFNKIKEEEKDEQSEESIKDYINTIKENCKNFKAWFEDKKGRERKKKNNYN